jgi:ribonucleases P/MRP protein subunit RPP40
MDIERLEKVQKKAVRMISGLRGKTYLERCEEIGLQTLEQRRHLQDLSLVHKYMTGQGNLNYEHMFEKAQERLGMRTRLAAGEENLKLPAARTELRRNSFAVRTITKWNSLPDEVKKIGGSVQFKRALNYHLGAGGRPAR